LRGPGGIAIGPTPFGHLGISLLLGQSAAICLVLQDVAFFNHGIGTRIEHRLAIVVKGNGILNAGPKPRRLRQITTGKWVSGAHLYVQG